MLQDSSTAPDTAAHLEEIGIARRVVEIAAAFLKLGCISFGGPVAHLGYFRNEFVLRRRWLDDAVFGDLVALCQFLPGPASSQVVFSIGMLRGGLAGAMAASCCFTLPSAVLMIAFAYGVAALGDLAGAGWLHGLKLAAVAVVAQAVWGMGRKLCPDRSRISMALIAAALLLAFPGALIQVAVLGAGALLGYVVYRHEIPAATKLSTPEKSTRGRTAAAAALIMFLALLLILPAAARNSDSRALKAFDSFYRAGSLVFGGGHVILPLLRAEVVPRGWVGDDRFLAGYGAAQAVPGPLFTFSGYLGTAIFDGKNAWLGGLLCLGAIFLPAWLLIGGMLPFWHSLREKTWVQAALKGANATVVGILLAALYQPVITQSVRGAPDVAIALLAFLLLQAWKVTPLVVVALAAGAGQWLLR